MKEIYIVILPDDKTKQNLNKIRKNISNQYGLNITNHPLHISLRTTFKTNNYYLLLSDLKKYVTTLNAFDIESTEYLFFNKKIMVLGIKKTEIIDHIEKAIVNICQKYNILNNKIDLLSLFKKKQNKYLTKYGDKFIFEYYNPHITLFYNTKNKDIKLNNLNTNFKFTCNSIAIIEKIKVNQKTIHKIKKIIKFN